MWLRSRCCWPATCASCRSLAAVPPVLAGLDRTAFGSPHDAVVRLMSRNLASSLERKNPVAEVAALWAGWTECSVVRIGNPGHFSTAFAGVTDADADAPSTPPKPPMPAPCGRHVLTAPRDIVLSLPSSDAFGLVAAEATLRGHRVGADA